jgi:hypothetical protein
MQLKRVEMDEPTNNGRGVMSGRFTLRNQFSQGNAIAKRTRELRQAIFEAVSPEQVKAVITKLAELAADGDAVAARLFLEYTCGRPAQSVELSGPDGNPLELQGLMVKIMAALNEYPAARFAVAKALHESA